MIPDLLTRAVSSQYHPLSLSLIGGEEDSQLEIPLSQKSLVFLCAEFSLSVEEEKLLKDIIHQAKLILHLTLFDLLIFDLHQEVSSLKHCARKEDFEKALGALELCYGNYLEGKNDVPALHSLLDNVIRNLIVSNNTLNYSASSSGNRVVALGDTKLITASLFPRVQLIKKFIFQEGCRAQFFYEPVSLLIGKDQYTIVDNKELKRLFEYNSFFLNFFFSSVERMNPTFKEFARFVPPVEQFGDPLAKFYFARDIDLNESIEVLGPFLEGQPWLIKIVKSLSAFQEIIDQFRLSSLLSTTVQGDLAYQKGEIPFWPHATACFQLDSNDKLCEFKAEQMVESSFQLSAEES